MNFIASVPVSSQAVHREPTPADWGMLAFFIPFSAWVLWTSWKWRRERHQSHWHR